MIDEIQGLLDQYWDWLKDKTTLRQLVGDWVEITTPHLDRHNDCIQIYAASRGAEILLTDDGYILDDLELSGCQIDTPKRQALLDMTLNGFGVRREGNELQIGATRDNFPMRKHNLVQAMLAVNDLFYLAAPTITSLFYEDVVNWLDQSNIRYTPNIKLTGKSGYDHNFEFVIPKSRDFPERVLRTVNRPDRQTVQSFVFAWLDTRDTRAPDARAYAILNDETRRLPVGAVDALNEYDMRGVAWSDRERALPDLAA